MRELAKSYPLSPGDSVVLKKENGVESVSGEFCTKLQAPLVDVEDTTP